MGVWLVGSGRKKREGVSVRHGFVPPHPRQSGEGQTDGGVAGGVREEEEREGVSVRHGFVPLHPRQSGEGQTDGGVAGGVREGGQRKGRVSGSLVSVGQILPPQLCPPGRGSGCLSQENLFKT